MIDAYKNVQIVQQDAYFFAYKDGHMQKCLFREDAIPYEFHNLLAAAPVLYAHSDLIASAAAAWISALEPMLVATDVNKDTKQLCSQLITTFSMIKQNSLAAMRVAEVGQRKAIEQAKASKN